MKIRLKKELECGYSETEIAEGTTLETLMHAYEKELPYTVLAAKMNNRIVRLTEIIDRPCRVEFLDMRTRAAHLIYQYSLTFMYLSAVRDVMGTEDVDVENPLNKGVFTIIRTEEPVSAANVKAIENRMHEMVKEDIPFELDGVHKTGSMQEMRFYKLKDHEQFFYGLMVPSTGYLKNFQLKKYKNGVILRFPQPAQPDRMPVYVDEKKMYAAFVEAARWQKLLDISFVWDLNEKIRNGEIREIIQMSGALHEKRIVEIAGEITEKKKRIVLIAGPSSSGKTTFARRLCIQLKVNGLKPLYLGTDDYFVDREHTPRDKNGEPNYEDLDALDVELFNRDMNALLKGETVDLPEFDFIQGKKIFSRRKLAIDADQPIVIEGIHALNNALTPYIDDMEKFRIYISPLTQLNIDRHNIISTTDSRMIRRMVRDHRARGHSARETIREWPKVRAGEDKNIFPYSNAADAFFNSVHIYELGVLKKYAEPLLSAIKPEEPEYSEAVRMLKFLSFFKIIDDDSIISNTSILREFIGGSVFVD